MHLPRAENDDEVDFKLMNAQEEAEEESSSAREKAAQASTVLSRDRKLVLAF